MTITEHLTRDVGRDPVLLGAIEAVAAPSYDDTSALLEREMRHCDRVYLGWDASCALACFFFTATEILSLDGNELVPTLYLGLSATRDDTKSSGRVLRLYHRCIRDAAMWERAMGHRLLLWGTTAHPTVYSAVANGLADVNPGEDGRYSPAAAFAARLLRRHMGLPAPVTGEHPFVLRGTATNTNYSRTERQRIARVRDAKDFDLFDRLSIDERCQDRLLFVARVPAHAPAADAGRAFISTREVLS